MQLGIGQVKQLLSLVGGSGGNESGGIQSGIKNAVLSKAITTIKRKFDSNPTDECLQECTDELNGVLGRFSGMLGDDLGFLSRFL